MAWLMVFNPNFYFVDKNEAPQYSKKPPGYLKVSRLLKNLPPWKKPGLAGETKQRSLIIADWTAAHWSQKKIIAVKNTLAKLLDEGFPVYLWQNGKVLALTKDTLHHLDDQTIRERIKPTFQNNLQSAAIKQHRLSQHQIHILDDYWINYLLSEKDELPERSLSMSDLLQTPHNAQYILSVIQKASPPLVNVIQDVFSEPLSACFLKTQKQFPNATFIQKYESFFADASLNIQTVVDGLSTFPLAFAPQIESFELSSKHQPIRAEILQQLLATFPHVKKLNLVDCDIIGTLHANPLLANLEVLHLRHTNCSEVTLQYLLTQAINPKSLIIYGDMELKSIQLTTVFLKTLEEFVCEAKSFSIENLHDVLTEATGLKKLSLVIDIKPDMDQINHTLERLEELTIAGEASWFALLQKNTHIKKLTLYNLSPGAILNTDFSLDKLEELHLQFGEIDYADMQKFFAMAPHLKKLVITELTVKDDSPNTFDGDETDDDTDVIDAASVTVLNTLEHLEELHIEDCQGPGYLLDNLFSQAIHLKKLTLRNMEDCRAMEEFTATSLPFADLEELDIESCDIQSEGLLNILTQATQLKKLGLHSYENIECLAESLLKIEHLEELDIRDLCISRDCLYHVLKQTPRLKILNLDMTTISNEDEDKDDYTPINFHLLKMEQIIRTKDTDISDEDYKTLLESAPNIVVPLFDNQEIIDPEDEDTEDTNMTVPHRANVGQPMDAETTYDPTANLAVTRYFTSCDNDHSLPDSMINIYRLEAFNNLDINQNPCAVSEAFMLSNINPIDLKPCHATYTGDILAKGKELAQSVSSASYFLGQQNLALSDEWQAIASLSPNETMNHVHLEPKDDSVEICYSERDNLYYIRSKEPCNVSFSFLLEIPDTPKQPLPDPIRGLIADVKNYAMSPLTIDKEDLTGDDYLRYILQQKKGSCRHRTLAFKTLMQQQHPEIPVRMILNDCHAFVELQINGYWTVIDLGGYPAQLTIHEPTDGDTTEEADCMSTDETAPFEKELETWCRSIPYSRSTTEYCDSIIQSVDVKKRLIELTSTRDTQALQLNLEAHCKQMSRPCFYIHSPDDLVCSAAFIQREPGGNKGISTKGPGGPLHTFLTAAYDKHNPPVLIVNYDNFDADDIVRFNSLLDDKRYVDYTPLSPDTMVVGLINTKKTNAYQGEDFYSRFDHTETCPFSDEQLYTTFPSIPLRPKKTEDGPTTVISLYHGNDWEERLLGYWEIHGDSFYFIEGELESAIKKGLPIEIQNGPWENEHFMLFWQQAYMRGKIEQNGREIEIPAYLQLLQQEGYDWHTLTTKVSWQKGLVPHARVLNPSSFSEFFIRYEYDSLQKSLSTTSGFLKACAGQLLHINLTRELSEDEWASFLTTCLQYRIQLTVHCAPSVTIPEHVTHHTLTPSEAPTPLQPWDGCIPTPTTALVSTDRHCTITNITSLDPTWQVIDVSECAADDLLMHTHYDFNPKIAKFTFEQTKCALLVALEQNKKVILNGFFSPALVDALTPLLLERQHQLNPPGQLLLLSDNEHFNYLPAQRHTVSAQEKQQALNQLFSVSEATALAPELLAESFSQLQARLSSLRSAPEGASSNVAWEGLLKLPQDITLNPFDATHSAEIASSFNQQRLLAVNKRLSHVPYVFLTGLTGVGKTSFVQKNLNTADTCLFEGRAQLRRWAENTSPQRKILFIDEANLSPQQWSEFEGLFNHSPGILIDGHYYPLTDQHKVIFAGNPINYGDERKLSPFFEQHGNALVFEPMPLEFIYEEILKPVFAKSPLEPNAEGICSPMLEVYRFLCEHAKNHILISPRELQMMALLVLSYSYQQKTCPEKAIIAAQYYAYQLGKNLLPEQHHLAFDEQFKAESKRFKHAKNPKDQRLEFFVTRSRSRIIQQLDDVLRLREFKHDIAQNDAQRYGGLGGIVLEGEPGIGKSKIVIDSLGANGYQEMQDFQDRPNKMVPEKPFYIMPASMQVDDKKSLLLTAFHEGAIVVCDEINSSPMMESFLNQLLMGKSPDNFPIGNQGGLPPRQPGFLIIGTQNPVSMQGRRVPSLALAKRLMNISIPAYTHHEMDAILKSKGMDEENSLLLVKAYENNLQKAHRQDLSPQPTFRDLLKVARLFVQKQLDEKPADQFDGAISAIATENPQPVLTNALLPKATIPWPFKKYADVNTMLNPNPIPMSLDEPDDTASGPTAQGFFNRKRTLLDGIETAAQRHKPSS